LNLVARPVSLQGVERENIASLKLAVAAAFITCCVLAVALLGAVA
jgi:hypothetical protein